MSLPPLYVVLDEDVLRAEHRDWNEVAAACLDNGARLLQVRGKRAGGRDLFQVTATLLRRTRSAGATLIVNDRADIAWLTGADGVHVGQDDLPAAAVRQLLPDALVGVSTHDEGQIAAAAGLPVSYAAIGPVFATRTKQSDHAPLGLDGVRRARAELPAAMPLVAIGGITLERAAAVLEAGAQSVAVIRDLCAAPDVAARTRAFVQALGS